MNELRKRGIDAILHTDDDIKRKKVIEMVNTLDTLSLTPQNKLTPSMKNLLGETHKNLRNLTW